MCSYIYIYHTLHLFVHYYYGVFSLKIEALCVQILFVNEFCHYCGD